VSSLARVTTPLEGFLEDFDFDNYDSYCAILFRELGRQLDLRLVRWSERYVEIQRSGCNRYMGRKDREGGMTYKANILHKVCDVYTLF
jgi:hypothetical protein